MPEIKNNFLQGKMNKDLDERLLPNGQYRDALNIEVSTSEGSDVGTAQNILGNYRVENIVDPSFKCVGSIANEKTNRLYWFVSKYDVDAILEYDINSDIAAPILVDANAGNSKAVLKFSGNIITGINIIDNLLFWTDNNGEPKKINIEECKKGTDADSFGLGNYKHTQLIFENGSPDGVTLDKVSKNESGNNFLVSRPLYGEFFWVPPIPFIKAVGNIDTSGEDVTGGNFDYAYSISTGYVFSVRHYRDNKFLGIKEVRYYGNTTEEAIEEGAADNDGTYGLLNTGSSTNDWKKGDVLFGDNITMDIEERHITVIKPKPLNALFVKINHKESDSSISNIPNLFETKFPRFSYRYKYRDGEYSPFAPFTPAVFNPKYPKDTSLSLDSNVFYNKDNAYDIKEPYNKAMVNSIHSVDLSSFVDAQTPEDVTEVDILYKQEESSVIYSIDTIKRSDNAWHLEPATQSDSIGYNKDFNNENYSTKGGLTKGSYLVTTENIYAALPANQLLRPWDNVPKKALAQEITGNRIVYGNYVQNYDLVNDARVSVSYSDRKNNLGSFDLKGLPSIKSQRNYQIGVVYCDEFGRETPVFTSKTAAVNVPWQNSSGDKNASQSNQLNASVANNFPEWVDSLKFFVKETSSPYYNLTMDRAWVTKSTYDLDDSEGHLWISFPSSDRNKISEDDYIVLKKKIGAGEEQVNFENKYKVIDIQNEAPDAIKYRLANIGVVDNYNDKLTDPTWGSFPQVLHTSHLHRIDKEGQTSIRVQAEGWMKSMSTFQRPLIKQQSFGTADLNESNHTDVLLDNLYISWSNSETGASSTKYRVTGGWKGDEYYFLKLSTPITRNDADIAHVNSNCAASQAELHPKLLFQVEQRELRENEDFSGKFFVKISKNQVTGIIETGNVVDVLDKFQINAKHSSFFWHDTHGSSANSFYTHDTNYGITNSSGSYLTQTGVDGILDAQNNTLGPVNAENHLSGDTSINSGIGNIHDYAKIWEGIQTSLNTNWGVKDTVIIDAMHMVAGQSDASNYAKYCCVTWSGTDDTNPDIPDGSCWSYPPLKTWITDYGDTINLIKPEGEDNTGDDTVTIPAESIWYENNLITTAPYTNTLANEDYQGLKVDGWVGPLQNVTREEPTYYVAVSHINGLEGFLHETNNYHTTGARRWFSGMTGDTHGVGVDTKTYGDEVGKHFIHLSFFAPGKDLHNTYWNTNGGTLIAPAMYGPGSHAANLQGIWGGGVFTGQFPDEKFGYDGDDDNKFFHLPMEGNNDVDGNILPGVPGPGVGQGYDIRYRELHERQWDPTFTETGDPINRKRDTIRNLYPGSKFRFNRKRGTNGVGDEGQVVYTIKSVQIKKLYNHTSWRKTKNRFLTGAKRYVGTPESSEPWSIGSSDHIAYKSVEEVGLEYLNILDKEGVAQDGGTAGYAMRKKIEEFGAAHNRRLCYIIELDKKTDVGEDPGFNGMSADIVNNDYADLEFLEPVQDNVLKDLSKFPAIWELSPKKSDVDLDIYYEASSNIPVRLNSETNELFAPIGCVVEVLNSNITSTSHLEFWDGNTAKLNPGLPKGDINDNEINYSSMSFKFTRNDGSYTIAEAGLQDLDGVGTGLKTHFVFREDIGDVVTHGLDWHNCFSFGNGLESNRIKDDFNEIFISNGVKASTTTQETYKEERRKSGLIYSGVYNSNSGVNDLNQFIQAEEITKDLNPTYGSIQKLFQRRISLIAFCEDRVVGITSNKDTIYNADGNPQLVASNKVLGDANPFEGNYGISTNPESFASESYRAYFADKQRGTVLRLSKDGLTPISSAGMKDWFRDNLPEYNTLLGTYDSYKDDYNITLSNNSDFNENLILDAYLETGIEVDNTQAVGSGNKIENPGVFNATPLQYLYDSYIIDNNLIANPFTWNDGNSPTFSDDTIKFKGSAQVINHQGLVGDLITDPSGNGGGALQPYIPYSPPDTEEIIGGLGDAIPFAIAEYRAWDNVISHANHPSPGSLEDNGWWYDPRFESAGDAIFGPGASHEIDAQIYSGIVRKVNNIEDLSGVNWNTSYSGFSLGLPAYAAGYDPKVSKPIDSKLDCTASASGAQINAAMAQISQTITRDASGGNNWGSTPTTTGAITFDRCDPTTSSVEFKRIGSSYYGNPGLPIDGGVMQTYLDNGGAQNQQDYDGNAVNYNDSMDMHRTIFNGDELHVQFELTCFTTATSSWADLPGEAWKLGGYNYIKPKLVLWDNSTNAVVDADLLATVQPGFGPTYTPFTKLNSGFAPIQDGSNLTLGSEFETPNYLDSGQNNNTYIAGDNVDYKHVKYSAAGSGTVIFPNTSGIAGATASSSDGLDSFTIMCGVTFKFRDPNQQNANGTYSGTVTYDGDGNATNGIQEKIVIPSLSIKIMNDAIAGNGYALYNDNGSWGYPLNNQLWQINNLYIKKGFSVAGPHAAYVDETTGGTGQYQDIPGTEVLEVQAVPPAEVPAWSQVVHADNLGFGSGSWTFIKDPGNSGEYIYQTAALSSSFGGIGGTWDAGAVQTMDGLSWVEPDGAGPIHEGYADFQQLGPIGNITPFQCNGTNGFGTFTTVEYESPNNSIVVGHPGGSYNYIVHDISSSPYSPNATAPFTNPDNEYYLVDVEYDENWIDANNTQISVSANSDIGGGGYLAIPHVGTQSTFTEYGIPDTNGVGVSRGSNQNHHIALVPVTRTEYGTGTPGVGDNKTVLRTIFKPANDSKAVQQGWSGFPNEFRLLGVNITNGIKIDKIIVKKLNQSGDWTTWLSTNGVQVADWAAQSGDANAPYEPQHAFMKRHIYHYGGMLCWEVPAGLTSDLYSSPQNTHHWEQEFGANIPTVASANDGWELSFTVSDNPKISNAFTGNLRGFVTISDGSATNGYEGVYFKDITHPGDYLIKFNFDHYASGSTDWKFQRIDDVPGNTTEGDYIDYTTGTIDGADYQAFPLNEVKDRISFSTEYAAANSSNVQEYAVSNIKLTDSMPIFSGGTAGSWSFDGFNASLNNYIYWDQGAENIVFNACPPEDVTTDELKFININQQIDKTINKGEKYEIRFTHGITNGSTADLSIYYYNTDGFGFKIDDIDYNTDGNTGDISFDGTNYNYTNGGAEPFKQVVTIGDSEWSNINENDSEYSADLKNSFVIQVKGNANDGITGYIDNLVMVQVFEMETDKDTTVSFNEGVKGWTSFKSFVPDNGLSLSKKYFTFDQGGLYQHYVPLKKDNNNDWVKGYNDLGGNFVKWTAQEAENYNTFYSDVLETDGAFSSITAVLNQEPSVVKMFNTVNYEGSQTYVIKPSFSNEVTINNAIAWSNGEDIKGWRCSEIKTDLDSGTVKEFIKKEGKWFNYIRGLNTDLTTTNTSLFSTQGIGVIQQVDDITQYDINGDEIILGGDGNPYEGTIGGGFGYSGIGGGY